MLPSLRDSFLQIGLHSCSEHPPGRWRRPVEFIRSSSTGTGSSATADLDAALMLVQIFVHWSSSELRGCSKAAKKYSARHSWCSIDLWNFGAVAEVTRDYVVVDAEDRSHLFSDHDCCRSRGLRLLADCWLQYSGRWVYCSSQAHLTGFQGTTKCSARRPESASHYCSSIIVGHYDLSHLHFRHGLAALQLLNAFSINVVAQHITAAVALHFDIIIVIIIIVDLPSVPCKAGTVPDSSC